MGRVSTLKTGGDYVKIAKLLLELLDLKLSLLLKEVKDMSTKFDALKTQLDNLAVDVDNVVTQNQALKAQLADALTNEEATALSMAITEQSAKLQAVIS